MTNSIIENGKKLESSVELSRYFSEIKKYWLRVCIVTIIVTGLCMPAIYSMTSIYVSTATVLIKAKDDNVSPIEKVETYDSTQAEYYPTQYDLIQSRVVLAEAVKLLKLNENAEYNGENNLSHKNNSFFSKFFGASETTESDHSSDVKKSLTDEMKIENAINIVRKNLTVSGVRLTQLVKVSYQSPSPKLAQEVANGVVEAYKKYTIDQKQRKTTDAEQWNNIQIIYLKNEIDKKKKIIDLFLKDNGLLTYNGIDGFESEQISIIANRLADAVQKRAMAQADYELVRNISSTNITAIANLPQISNHSQLQDLKIALIQATRKLSELQKKYGPKFNSVIEAKAEIAAIQQQTDRLLQGLKSGIYDNYQIAVANENEYKRLLSLQKDDFSNITSKRDRYNELKADLDKTQELYQELYKRTQEQKISAKYEEADVILYDPAVLPIRPIKPNKPLFVVMVSVLSFIITVIFLMVKLAINKKLKSSTDVKNKIGLEVIGEIPYLSELKINDLTKSLMENSAGIDILLGIKNRILFNHKNVSTIGFTSSTSKEGASFVLYALASVFSQDNNVLILDLNYRTKNGLSSMIKSNGGFFEWVNSSSYKLDYYISQTQYGADFLSIGNLDYSSLQFLMEEKTKIKFSELCNQYDLVFVDLPALSDGQDGLIVAEYVDKFLYTMSANMADTNEIINCVESLQAVNANILGSILNKVSPEYIKNEDVIRFLSDFD